MSQFSKAFEAAIDHLMLYEVGGFWSVNHPAVSLGLINTKENRHAVGYVNIQGDRGGETKFGIAKNANPDIDITNLTYGGAKAIYFLRYWIPGKCSELPPRISVLHFDGCANHGVSRAARILQEAIQVERDGIIGPSTIAKIKELSDIDVCNKICDIRKQFYNSIVMNNPSQNIFLDGWLRRISELRSYTTNPSNSFI